MNREWLATGGSFIVFFILQIFVFDAIYLGIYLNLQIYIIFILFLSPGFSGFATLLLSFLIGFVIDAFSGTLGMHASACLAIGYLRNYLLRITSPNNIQVEIPSFKYDFQKYFIYTGVMIFLHHLILFSLDSFYIKDFDRVLLRVVFSGVVNFIIILVIRMIMQTGRR